MTALLDRARDAEQQQSAEALHDYRDLVAAAVAGTDDGSDPLPVLQAAGKTAADFASDINAHRHREALRQQKAAAQDTGTRRAEILGEIEASAAKLRKAQDLHHRTTHPLRLELADLEQQATAAAAIDQQLIATAPAELRERFRLLESQSQQLGNRLFGLTKNRGNQQDIAQARDAQAACERERLEVHRRMLEE